ncbi:MAG: hypothetical protein ACRC77_10310, partial [Bacteroidales bacterium]
KILQQQQQRTKLTFSFCKVIRNVKTYVVFFLSLQMYSIFRHCKYKYPIIFAQKPENNTI